MSPEVQAAQIRIVGEPSLVNDAVMLLESDHPPAYLELFNEPDYIWGGDHGIKVEPIPAAKALEPILKKQWPKTKLISPALAHSTNQTWWDQFNGPKGCNGCMHQMDIVAGHFYDNNATNILERVETFAKMWPGKDIWLTEFAPATRNMKCNLRSEEMMEWMKTVMTALVTRDSLKQVKKLFWNAGEWVR